MEVLNAVLFYHGSGPKYQYDTIYLALLMPYFMFISAMSIIDEYYKHSDEVRSNAVLHVALFIVIQWDTNKDDSTDFR